MSGLAIRNLGKSFDGVEVLRDISFELAGDELLVLLGPSGCGKTTLLRLVAGLEEADRGEIYIADRRVDHLRPRDRNVALLFQNYSLYPHMTVAKNLAFPLRVAGVGRGERHRRVQQVAQTLGLADRLDAYPAQLSGGQRQRVALGRAIIRQPALFLFDEPLSNLDADLRARMRREIVQLQKKLKTTAIHVTHDQAEALTMGDRIALLNDGRIIQLGSPQELYGDPANRFVAEFIGFPKINLVPARIEKQVLIPFGVILVNQQLQADQLLVGIRPEQISITPDGEYVATVESSEYLGGQYVVTLSFKGESLTVANCPTQLSPGRTVNFTFNVQDLLFFESDTGRRLDRE